MPCQQFPKYPPPANAKGGPFDTEQECKESVGTAGGCPCCSDNDCPKCYCLLNIPLIDPDYTEGAQSDKCPNGFVQASDDTGYFYPTCTKVIPDFDCSDPASCMFDGYTGIGFDIEYGIVRRYTCCCQQRCIAPTSSEAAVDNWPGSAPCKQFMVSRPGWRVEGFNSREECLAGGNRTEQDCDKLYYWCEGALPPHLIDP